MDFSITLPAETSTPAARAIPPFACDDVIIGTTDPNNPEQITLLRDDPRKPDQNLRGAVMLPHGTGKTVRVAVFARGDRAKEAESAGADIVGAEDLAEKIQAGQIDFDRAIAD